MIKAVLFDADGVIINGKKLSFHLVWDYGISEEKTLPFFTGLFTDCLIGKEDLKEIIKPYIKEWGWKKSVDEFLDYWFKAEHNIDEELMDYIQQLRKRGIKCCLATNQEKHRVAYMLDKMTFSKSFDKVYSSAYVGYKKPSFDFFSKIIEDLGGIEKDEVLFWDDSIDNVSAAKRFGIIAELYKSYEDFKSKMSEYIRILN